MGLLDSYPPEDLTKIVNRSATLLGVAVVPLAAAEIGKRSRGTPRIANRMLRRVRDFAQVEGDGRVTVEVARSALDRLDVDACGLDAMDRKYLGCIIDKFGGGPVGVETLGAALGEEADTLESVYEPFLLQEGYLKRTPRGRMATLHTYELLGRPAPHKLSAGELL